MTEWEHLPLTAASGGPLMHQFRRHPQDAAGLLMVFPGNRYGTDGPLLYYPRARLWRAGWDTLAVVYGFQTAMTDFAPERFEETQAECREAVRAALSRAPYRRLALLGKSLGASVVAHLCAALPELAGARAAYLTPPLGTPGFDPVFPTTPQPAYLALGTADVFYRPEALQALRGAKPFELTLIQGGDHSLDVGGDEQASLRALGSVSKEAAGFLSR